MEQSPWEADRFSASQEIPRILCNPQGYYRIHMCHHLSVSWACQIQAYQFNGENKLIRILIQDLPPNWIITFREVYTELMHCYVVFLFFFFKYLTNAEYMISSWPVASKSMMMIPGNFLYIVNFRRRLALKKWRQLASPRLNRARRLTCFISASVTRKHLQFGTRTDSSFQRHYRFRPTGLRNYQHPLV
jgi:hypothetical protein